MTKHIKRSINKHVRNEPSWDERWLGSDKGLITCWEVGRKLRKENPELAKKALNGELPILGWKGGIEKKLKKKEKYGCLQYLAQLQGLRNEDLDIYLDKEIKLTCSKTRMMVIFTSDRSKYSPPDIIEAE